MALLLSFRTVEVVAVLPVPATACIWRPNLTRPSRRSSVVEQLIRNQ